MLSLVATQVTPKSGRALSSVCGIRVNGTIQWPGSKGCSSMDNAAMLGVIVPSIAIGIGLMLVAYGPHIDAFQRRRGDGDFLWARVPARTRASSQSQQGSWR
jgi:hypothetical protein